MSTVDIARQVTTALDAGEGILHLAPNWVPRAFLTPGRRLRLAEDDLYVLGADRGGIDERWFASSIQADNGPGTPEDEGMSYVVGPDGERFLFADAIEVAGARIIGQEMMDRWGRWPIFCKFFDNMGPIPHHLHQRRQHAALVGREPKPEAYYFPPQMNSVHNDFPYTFFGLEPGVTRADVYRCLERWNEGDNGILDLSKAYRLRPGTGWLVPSGVLHAPGSLCTYEVQWASDVYAIYQSMADGRPIGWDQLVKDVPEDRHDDLEFLVDLIDWEANVTPTFKADHYLEPLVHEAGDGYQDRWVIYGTIRDRQLFSAKELTVVPGARTTIRDEGASGLIVVQGHGTIGPHAAEAAGYVRYGELTQDEFFITAEAARDGVPVENTGHESLVLLRYFGPDVHTDLPEVGAHRK